MVVHEKARRRASAGPTPANRSRSERNMGADKATRRRSTGPGEPEGEEVGTAEPFDPFSTEVTEALEQAVKDGGTNIRRAPTRSASVGALPISAADFAAVDFGAGDDDPFDDDDMMFDEVDWDNVATAESSQKKKEKGKSRTSKQKDDGSDDYDSKDEDEEKKEKRKKKSTKSRRQSLDSALPNAKIDEDDGFGPIKTYGFNEEAPASSDRRKGMSRSKSASGDNLDLDSGHAPKRVIHRRRSETSRTSRRRASASKTDGDTEATAESLDVSVNA